MTCGSCGDKPKKCNKDFTKAVIEIDNPEQITLMRKVTIPASMGDDTAVPPVVGKYHNVLLYYEANQKSYLYSSDGIPTQLVNGVTDYEAAVNLPQINGYTLLGNKTGDQLGLQNKLTAGENISIDSDNVISAVDTTYGPATDTEIGLVKPGDGLDVDANGTMSISNIEQYAHFFDTVADMKTATNLVAGDYVRTLGFHSINDGGEAYYKITDTGTANEMDVVLIESGLYAHLISPLNVYPEIYGAYGDNAHNDTNVIQYAFNLLKTNGGTFNFMNGKTYLVDGNVITMNGVTKQITIEGNNAILKQTGSTSTATVYYNEYLTVNNLHLVGSSDVNASVNYWGFRSLDNSGTTVFNNCSVALMTVDGWYHNYGTLELNNCIGTNNTRCDVALTNGNIIINGGVFGTPDLSVASIDIEPNEGNRCDFARLIGCKCTSGIQIWGNAGGSYIEKVELKDVTLDNTNNNASIRTSRCGELIVTNLIKINNPEILIDDSTVAQRGIKLFDEYPDSLNLVNDDYTTWTISTSGQTAQIFTDATASLFNGKNITTVANYWNIKKEVTVEPNTIYTFGLMIDCKQMAGNRTGMYATCGSVTKNIQEVVDYGPRFVSSEIDTGENTTLTLRIGSGVSQPVNFNFAKPFLFKGRINKETLAIL